MSHYLVLKQCDKICSSVLIEAVQDKLDQMVFLWNDIQALLEEREAKLLDVMDLAEKFWCDHCALIVTIKDTHDLLKELEDPGVDPSVVKQQQESVEVRRLQNQTFDIDSALQKVFIVAVLLHRALEKRSMGCRRN